MTFIILKIKNNKFFGDLPFAGIYFADSVTKSANYCRRHLKALGDDEEVDDIVYVLVCDVALGNVLECTALKKIEQLHSGKTSIKACGKFAPLKSDYAFLDGIRYSPGPLYEINAKASLEHNEFVVNDVSRVKIKYILEMKIKDFK